MTTIDRIKAALAAGPTPGPWTSDYMGGSIGCENAKIGGFAKLFDVRGWGYLTGNGHGALGLSQDEGAKVQRANRDFVIACNPAAISELIASHEALGRQVAASSATLQEGQEEWLSSVRNIGTQMANVLFNLRQRETVAGAEADTIKAIIEAWDAIPMSPPQQATVLTQPALEQAIGFIESLTADPLLIGDETEMTLEDVQAYARIELTSIRKALASSTPPHTQEEGERGEGPAPEKHMWGGPETSPELYRTVHDAATAVYEASTPADYRYSASALRQAVDAGIRAALTTEGKA